MICGEGKLEHMVERENQIVLSPSRVNRSRLGAPSVSDELERSGQSGKDWVASHNIILYAVPVAEILAADDPTERVGL